MTTPIESESDPMLAAWAEEVALRVREGRPVDFSIYDRLDPGRADQLRGLLPAMELMAGLHSPPIEATQVGSANSGLGLIGGTNSRMLGEFTIVRELGRGGMGIVYEAEQPTLGRRVALKVLPPASALDPLRLQRFEMEMKALALLNHPHIVPVYAVGDASGIPYFAMPLIRGQDLAQVIGELRRLANKDRALDVPIDATLVERLLSGQHVDGEILGGQSREDSTPHSRSHSGLGRSYFRTVARLGVQAAGALAHAHGLGVLHRDIKPANLLLDAGCHLWVTDFGLARLQGDDGPTISSDLLGTLRYTSPEQARARRGQVDQRTDVYSLGLTLYELLTLEPAFPVGDDRPNLLRRIAEDEPIAPRKLNPSIPPDLETIVRKAMAKDPDDRYASATDFADDLGRFLRREPILARRAPIWERAWKWSRRRPLQASFLALAALMVVVLAGGVTILEQRNRSLKTEIDRADRHARDADAQRSISRRHLYDAQIHLARQALDLNQIERAQDILEEIKPDEAGVDPRGFSWHYLRRLSRNSLIQLRGLEGASQFLAPSLDGRRLICRTDENVFLLWNLAQAWPLYGLSPEARDPTSGKPRALLLKDLVTDRVLVRMDAGPGAICTDSQICSAGFLQLSIKQPDGSYSVETWDLSNDPPRPRRLMRLDGQQQIESLWDHDFITSVSGDRVTFRDPRTGLICNTLAHNLCQIWPREYSRDGRYTASPCPAEGTMISDTKTGTELARLKSLTWDLPAIFSPDGARLAIPGGSGRINVWDWKTGRLQTIQTTDPDPKWRMVLTFSPDGSKICAALSDQAGGGGPVELWDVSTGNRVARFPGRPSRYGWPVFAHDGHSIFLPEGRTIRRWFFERPPLGGPDTLAGHLDETWAVAFSPDGRFLVSGSDDDNEPRTIKVWDTATDQLVRSWWAGRGTVSCLAVSPDGRTIASGHLKETENVRLWDLKTGTLRATLSGHTDKVRAIAFSSNGLLLATAGSDKSIRVWDGRTGEKKHILTGHADTIRTLAFRGDGRILASSGNDGTTKLWDAVAGTESRSFPELQRVASIEFIPGSTRLATVGESGIIALRETSSDAPPIQLLGEDGELRTLVISPDSRTLAVAGKSGKIDLWDLLTAQELLTLEGHKAQINGMAFSPDGRTLASCSHDGGVKLWRSEDPHPPH